MASLPVCAAGKTGILSKTGKFYWKKRDFHDRMTGIIEENNGRAGGVRKKLDKKNMKSIMLLILFAVLLYLGVQNIDVVLDVIATVIGLVFPFILGGGIAFVLNVPMSFAERNIFGRGKLKGSKAAKKAARPVSLILAILFVIFIIAVVGGVVLPELERRPWAWEKGLKRDSRICRTGSTVPFNRIP